MTPDLIFEWIKGPQGTLALLILILTSVLTGYPMVPTYVAKEKDRRIDRLDEVVTGSLRTNERVLERAESIVVFEERALENDVKIMQKLDAIAAEQSHAKDRESWPR